MIIDVHHHFVPQAYVDRLAEYLPPGLEVRRSGDMLDIVRTADEYVYPRINVPYWTDPKVQLAMMDRAGVDHAVLSPACFPDWMTMAGARIINDGTAELIAAHPDRFSGMITVPPDGGAEMVAEIRRASELPGMCALNTTTTHGDRYPDHPDFQLFFATAAELGLPVFVHPSWIGPVTTFMDKWNVERTLGKPHDLSLGIARMIFSGALQRHAGLQMMFGHLGGGLPMYLKRLFFGQKGYTTVPEDDFRPLLERIHVDTAPGMWQSSDDVTFAVRKLGEKQVLLGSDYPLSMHPETIMELAVENTRDADLGDDAKHAVMCGNAIRLFGLERLARGPVAVRGCDCGTAGDR